MSWSWLMMKIVISLFKKLRNPLQNYFIGQVWNEILLTMYLHVKHVSTEAQLLYMIDKVPVKPIITPVRCFEVVSIDICGPIDPPSSNQHKYILGFICQLTRWPEAHALKSLTWKEICDAILKFCSYARIPRVFTMDNASYFVSKL